MKHLRKYNEAKSHPIDKAAEIEADFEKAYKSGSASFNVDYYSSDWSKVKSKYHLYDDFYLYKDAVFVMNTRPSSDWYYTELRKIDKPLHIFKEDVYKRIEQLESAFNKL
jgi:hypothetical protein